MAAALIPCLVACFADRGFEQPEALFQEVPIRYPVQLWDQEIQGETVLRVLVNETGGVDSVEVAASSGHIAFDSAAIRGARELRFKPARRGDRRIKVWAEVPVQFSKKPRPEDGPP